VITIMSAESTKKCGYVSLFFCRLLYCLSLFIIVHYFRCLWVCSNGTVSVLLKRIIAILHRPINKHPHRTLKNTLSIQVPHLTGGYVYAWQRCPLLNYNKKRRNFFYIFFLDHATVSNFQVSLQCQKTQTRNTL